MKLPDPATLWKRTAKRAATSPTNVVSGAVAIAASAALWNPLPLILWGLGSASWVLFATTSKKQLTRSIEEGREEELRKIALEREALAAEISMSLAQGPFSSWIKSGYMPDYAIEYRRLLDMRHRITRFAHDRSEIEDEAELGIGKRVDYMLNAYLQFVKARITYLRILHQMGSQRQSVPMSGMGQQGKKGKRGGGYVIPPPLPGQGFGPPMPSLEELLADIDERIQDLQEAAEKEPASAQARQWHMDILKKQRELLVACGERDQSVSAQLMAFPDAFSVIMGQMSASQIDQSEIASTMEGIVEKVEQTERYVKALGPSMDQMLSGLAAGGPGR
jgi:hypothetical protein